jgi:predicted DsbA family dithiol-disulfide isomerase
VSAIGIRPIVSCVRVEIWSDVICPWCYIGKRRFETALANVSARRDTSGVEVVYRPFQLDPTAAPGRVQSVPEAYARKFGGPERATQIINHITDVAAESGIEFHLDRAQRANTLLAHRALTFAEHHGQQAELKERLMQAYFTDGENVGDIDVLVRCATEVGLEADALRAALEGDDGRAEVMEHLAEAASNGITAVPTYVINGQWAVPGAQDVAVFERVIDRILDSEQPVASTPAGTCEGEACDV